jgi:DNA-binding response OmpR family regulator
MNILIVEDESIVEQEIEGFLKSLGNICVCENTPENIYAIIEHRDIELVFMDINLNRDVDGIEIATEIKKRNCDVNIIYITSYVDDATVARALLTDPIGYLTKPYKTADLSILIKIVQNRHQKSEAIGNDLVDFFDHTFSYNTVTKKLFNNGIRVALRKRDIFLMDLIVQSLDKAFITNEEIEDAVWGAKTVSDTTRRVVVSALNLKFNGKLLHNEYGRGYSIKH